MAFKSFNMNGIDVIKKLLNYSFANRINYNNLVLKFRNWASHLPSYRQTPKLPPLFREQG